MCLGKPEFFHSTVFLPHYQTLLIHRMLWKVRFGREKTIILDLEIISPLGMTILLDNPKVYFLRDGSNIQQIRLQCTTSSPFFVWPCLAGSELGINLQGFKAFRIIRATRRKSSSSHNTDDFFAVSSTWCLSMIGWFLTSYPNRTLALNSSISRFLEAKNGLIIKSNQITNPSLGFDKEPQWIDISFDRMVYSIQLQYTAKFHMEHYQNMFGKCPLQKKRGNHLRIPFIFHSLHCFFVFCFLYAWVFAPSLKNDAHRSPVS